MPAHDALIAFDLDGTLIDSRRDLANSANELIESLGGTALPEAAIGRMVGEGAAVLVSRALDAARIAHPPDAVARFLDIYARRELDHTRPYTGIDDVVRLARERAYVAVLTNKPQAPSERILDALGLLPLFDRVIGGDTPCGRKPDPAGLHALMSAAGAGASRTLLVGDSAIDHETTLRSGVRCCLVTFGFGYENFPADRLTGREWLAADVGALRDIVLRFRP